MKYVLKSKIGTLCIASIVRFLTTSNILVSVTVAKLHVSTYRDVIQYEELPGVPVQSEAKKNCARVQAQFSMIMYLCITEVCKCQDKMDNIPNGHKNIRITSPIQDSIRYNSHAGL